MTDSIEQMWHTYHTKLHHFIHRRVGDAASADDILQEVFLRIHARIDTLNERSKLHRWVYQITRHAIIDHYRADARGEDIPAMLSATEMEPHEKARHEIKACLVPMMQGLPDHYRQALMLSDLEGVRQQEVARQQGVSLSGAKSRVQRGRAMLKDLLLACCHFEFDHRGIMIAYEQKRTCCHTG